uniref:(California timema) hypothetical protein n=1 Tax=Timema californicum TaxID=61474 RepID=A0A7R9PBM1_TIMCA|nr:unnamed protein product [Timema californicum]
MRGEGCLKGVEEFVPGYVSGQRGPHNASGSEDASGGAGWNGGDSSSYYRSRCGGRRSQRAHKT